MDELDIGYSKKPSSLERSALEACCLKAVQGPGIVTLQGVGEDGELVLARAACSVADVLAERGRLSEGEVRAVGAAAAAALARVHDAGFVHGDMKPANLLLSHGGDLWLADLDSAAPADGRVLGHFSPGRLAPGTPALAGADIAALAIALVELSTGILIDPGVSWRAGDLRRIGCSPSLSAEISFMLERDGTTRSARSAADMLGRGELGALPAPAARARRVDPTPTVEFMPARPVPPLPPPTAPTATDRRSASLWSRFAETRRRR